MLNFILNMLQCSESVLEQALSLLPFVSSSARHMEANRLEHLRAKAAKQKKVETEATEVDTSDVDDLLDEIDGVLEENAEEFVKNYVQKGGQ